MSHRVSHREFLLHRHQPADPGNSVDASVEHIEHIEHTVMADEFLRYDLFHVVCMSNAWLYYCCYFCIFLVRCPCLGVLDCIRFQTAQSDINYENEYSVWVWINAKQTSRPQWTPDLPMLLLQFVTTDKQTSHATLTGSNLCGETVKRWNEKSSFMAHQDMQDVTLLLLTKYEEKKRSVTEWSESDEKRGEKMWKTSVSKVAWEIRVDAGALHVVASLGVDAGPVLGATVSSRVLCGACAEVRSELGEPRPHRIKTTQCHQCHQCHLQSETEPVSNLFQTFTDGACWRLEPVSLFERFKMWRICDKNTRHWGRMSSSCRILRSHVQGLHYVTLTDVLWMSFLFCCVIFSPDVFCLSLLSALS